VVNLNELKAQRADENAAAKNRLHTLYEKLQDRLAVDLKNARDAKGEASEGIWHQLFNAYLPRRYRVIKGIVIDCNGEESDVIIHDRQFTPAIYGSSDYRTSRQPLWVAEGRAPVRCLPATTPAFPAQERRKSLKCG